MKAFDWLMSLTPNAVSNMTRNSAVSALPCTEAQSEGFRPMSFWNTQVVNNKMKNGMKVMSATDNILLNWIDWITVQKAEVSIEEWVKVGVLSFHELEYYSC